MIHLNGRFLFSDHPTGTHRSAENFVRALASVRGFGDLTLWGNASWPRTPRFLSDLPIRFGHIPANSAPMLHGWEQFRFPTLTKGGVGLNLLGTGPALFGCERQVMLVHDLNSLIMPEAFSWKFRRWSKLAKYRAIRRAGGVFCLTAYVRDTLANKLGMDVSCVEVVPQGPGLAGIDRTAAPCARDARRSFLCVGSLQPHKNLARVIAAWQLSGLAEDGHELRIIGKPQRNFSYTSESDGRSAKGVAFTGYLTDEALCDEYRRAVALVFPSLHEGFGLPIVEAFFAGTPVITSSASCMPEVAGDAALLVDPQNVHEIADGMRTVAKDSARWGELADRAWRRRHLYTWANAGRKLSALLDDFIQLRAHTH